MYICKKDVTTNKHLHEYFVRLASSMTLNYAQIVTKICTLKKNIF